MPKTLARTTQPQFPRGEMIPLTNGDKITANQLAELTGKSVKTVYSWTSRGVLLPNGQRYILPVTGLGHRGEKLFDLVDAQKVVHAVTLRGTNPTRVLAA